MTDRQLITATSSLESTIVFAAKMGWIRSKAPNCSRELWSEKNNTSSLRKKGKRKRDQIRLYNYFWRFRCCGRLHSVLRNTMFFNSTYGLVENVAHMLLVNYVELFISQPFYLEGL